MRPRLFLLQPALVFRAQINQSDFSYPIASVTYDNVTEGAYTNVIYGQTVVFSTSIGAADLGRQRVRRPPTSDTFYFGRSSRGTRDGEVSLRDDAWIEVWDLYQVWPRIPTMPVIDGQDLTTYKDHDIAVGLYTTTPPPVANIGPGYAGTIDPDTEVITVEFDASHSWAVADGATITGYQWFMYDGTITVGTDTDAAVTATFPAGFRWVALTVEDSNGLTHTARCPVYARDPNNDTSIAAFEITRHRITPQGQEIEVRVLEDIPQATYPDGTLALLWDDDAVTSGRSHMWLIGWHHTDPAQITSGRLGLRRDTTLELRDVAGKLDSLPGFPQVLLSDTFRDTTKFPQISWEYMVNPTIKKYLHYLLQWHSTALDLADFRFRGSTASDDYPFLKLQSDGMSLWDQVASRAQQLTPDHLLTCTRRGELAVWPDPMLIDPVERTEASQGEILEEDWTDIRYTHQRPPRVYWLRAGAILTQSSPTYNEDGSLKIPTVFCIAPGEAPGTGEIQQEENERLALSQEALNRTIGHKYARLNAPQSHFQITLADSDDRGLEPANLEWVWVGLNPEIAAQRGLSFVTFAGSIPVYWERGLVHAIDIRYQHSRTGLLRTITVEWEREVSGPPAVTVIPPAAEPADDYDPGFTIPAPEPDLGFGGGLKGGVEQVAAILSIPDDNGAWLYRTSDFQTASGDGGPTWEAVQLSDITDDELYSWVVDPFSPGYRGVAGGAIHGWAVGDSAIWRIEDIFGATPAATAVHTFAHALPASIQATRTIGASFGRYFPEESDNPWLICVSHYHDLAGHTGTWATYSVDGGQTWAAEVQISLHYDQSAISHRRPVGLYMSPKTPGLAYAFAYRETANPAEGAGYQTTDWGATWTEMTGELPPEDPAEPYVYWTLMHQDETEVTSAWANGGGQVSADADIVGSGGFATNTDGRWDLLIAPPADTKRLRVTGTWRCIFQREYDGLSTPAMTADAGVNHPASLPLINADTDFAFDAPSFDSGDDMEAESEQAAFYAEWTKTGAGTWGGNRDVLIAGGAIDRTKFARFRARTTVAGGTAGSYARAFVVISLRIVEVELDNGHIYTPPLAPALLDPGHRLAGDIHLPWANNDDEGIIYHGHVTIDTALHYALMRMMAGQAADISPQAGGVSYGVNHYGFAVRSYDNNRAVMAVGAQGNDSDLTPANNQHGVWLSTNAGSTWSNVIAPVAASNFRDEHGFSVAFAADTTQVLYVWGPKRGASVPMIQYSSNFGVSFDDRTGDMLSGDTSDTAILGICGGPTS